MLTDPGYDLDQSVDIHYSLDSLEWSERMECLRSENAGPAPSIRRAGVSSGVVEWVGYGSLRHVSSVDRFIAWADPRP
jgi:hypothetical protein